jgi:translation elongation factor EF-G
MKVDVVMPEEHRMHAIRREDVDEVFTGDIAAAVGLKSF